MSFDPLSALFDLGKSAIDKIWPDPIKRAEELRKLEELKQSGDMERLNAHVRLMLGQIEINKAEAQHKSVFVAGWRPFIGWIGGIALAWQFILYPIFMWIWTIGKVKGWIPSDIGYPPVLDSSELYVILTGILGIGTMRSIDKRNKVSTEAIK